MVVVYRTTGPWGAGKGSNLTAEEVDSNFYGHDSRIKELEDNPPDPAVISDISMVGDQMTIQTSDGQTFGPFTMPAAMMVWTGDWTPNTSYPPLCTFIYRPGGPTSEGTQYFTGSNYVSGETFDPDSPEITAMFVVPGEGGGGGGSTVNVVNIDVDPVTDEAILLPEHMGGYVRAAPQARFVIPSATDDIPVGSTVTVRALTQWSSITSDGTTVVNMPPGFLWILRDANTSATLVKVGADEWDVTGDFMLE